jgi:hypothetical protein
MDGRQRSYFIRNKSIRFTAGAKGTEAQGFIKDYAGAALAANHLADSDKFAAKAAPANSKETSAPLRKKTILNKGTVCLFNFCRL